jgi:hypothetical protein
VPSVSARHLRNFLIDPAEAQLKRHLHLEEDEEIERMDSEPVISSKQLGTRLVRQVLHEIVLQSALGRAEEVLRDWPRRFDARYEDWRLRCRVPEQGFAEVDRQALRSELQHRLELGLAVFLRKRRGAHFCGPILMGESLQPMEPRIALPALELLLTRALPHLSASSARLVGDLDLAWTVPDALEVLLIVNTETFQAEHLHWATLEPILFYLMLLANDETGPEGWSAREWVAKRAFRLHFTTPNGLRTLDYPARSIRPAEARNYLADLVTDFLDPDSCEALPFTLLSDKLLRDAFEKPEDPESVQTYADRLRDQYVAALSNTHNPDRIRPLVRYLDLTVPNDAYDKVRRRFTLLDRGPARARSPGAPSDPINDHDDDTEDF